MTPDPMTCTDLEQQLGAYLDGDLDDAGRAAVERHLAGCPHCATLVADLERIATDAAALPSVAPGRDLWAGIDARIAPPVLGLDGRRARPDAARHRRRWTAGWPLAAAAAALVAITAGVTREATLRSAAPTRVTVADPTAAAAAPAVGTPAITSAPPAAPVADAGAAAPSSGTTRSAGGRRRAPRAPLAAGVGAESAAGEDVYAAEIAALRVVVQRRRAELDPATVEVVERSIEVIDAAIAQSRAALAADPRSPFLGQQLGRALDRKVELLRTAATLPSRT